ncbi:MAG: hypothetical protein FD155_3059 [Bacteroidetes bacterium]|nr:MAG: hypothetical protein FD155_3059 [Bacteroidota bacterium]
MENNLVQKSKRALSKGFKILLIILVVILIGVFSFYYWGVYERGVLAGKVLRVAEKGVVFKTWEGKLNLETFGALKGTSPIAETFDFSVERSDDEVITDLKTVALTGERVNLHFIKRYTIFPWRGDTRYYVTKVERLKE